MTGSGASFPRHPRHEVGPRRNSDRFLGRRQISRGLGATQPPVQDYRARRVYGAVNAGEKIVVTPTLLLDSSEMYSRMMFPEASYSWVSMTPRSVIPSPVDMLAAEPTTSPFAPIKSAVRFESIWWSL